MSQEKRRRFGEKTFGVHDSPVTKMLTKQDFQSIYNIFITIMVWLGVNILLQVWRCPLGVVTWHVVVGQKVGVGVYCPQFMPGHCLVNVCVVSQEWFVHHRLVDTSMFFIAFGYGGQPPRLPSFVPASCVLVCAFLSPLSRSCPVYSRALA